MTVAPPIWDDESSAGLLFPNAQPIPPKWIASDYSAIASVEDFRTREQADIARREARREREQSPEGEEARWQAEREKARAEMRRERRQGRIDAGIETAQPEPDYAGYCIEWVDEVEREMFGHVAISDPLGPAFSVSLKQAAQGLADFAKSINAVRFSFGPFKPDDEPHKSIMQMCNDLAAFHEPEPTKPAKAKPDRERYLPGTRHSGKRKR